MRGGVGRVMNPKGKAALGIDRPAALSVYSIGVPGLLRVGRGNFPDFFWLRVSQGISGSWHDDLFQRGPHISIISGFFPVRA